MGQNFREKCFFPLNVRFRGNIFVITEIIRERSRSDTPTCNTWLFEIENSMAASIRRRCEFQSCIRGYHVYEAVWTPVIGEVLTCARETTNSHDPYAVIL